ncbi:MAG: calcium/sodium antiporter [Mesorhizobium sp.]
MSLWIDLLLVIAGMGLLFGGGELLVRGATGLARRYGVSELVIGLTIVGFATSTPELLVSVQAALKGAPEIAIGNVVGSNIANILLIGGSTALLATGLNLEKSIRRELHIMLGASLLVLVAAAWGAIPRPAGLVLVLLLAAYLAVHFRAARRANAANELRRPDMAGATPAWRSLLALTAGLGMLFAGANWLVDGASSIARSVGVSEAVIGLTVVALGTSLPELATSIVAAWRGRGEVAVGNVIGSNIFNVLGILGVTAMIEPLSIASRFLWLDVPLMLAVSVLFSVAVIARSGLGRGSGAIMLAAYLVYTVALFALPG